MEKIEFDPSKQYLLANDLVFNFSAMELEFLHKYTKQECFSTEGNTPNDKLRCFLLVQEKIAEKVESGEIKELQPS